jgi:hypothetical protein
VLPYGNEAGFPEPGTPEFDEDMAGHDAFAGLAGERIVGGEALESVTTAVTVHPGDDGGVRITHGPFAETTEVLGGLYVLDVASLDDAIELARNIPTAAHVPSDGAIEIRPLVQWSDRAAEVTERPTARRYLATIHGTETDAETPGSDGWDAGAVEHHAFADAAGDALLAGGAVHPTHTATTIRVRDGELVTDGHFAEAIEIVGGFYVLRADSDEAAAELAGRIPLPPDGWVELRSVMELDG